MLAAIYGLSRPQQTRPATTSATAPASVPNPDAGIAPQVVEEPGLDKARAASAVRNFENEHGANQLKYEKLRDYVPALVDYFLAEHPQSGLGREDTLRHVYVVRGVTPEELLADYPEAQIPQATLDQTTVNMATKYGWIDLSGNVFVNYLGTNEPSFPLEFRFNDGRYECGSVAPAVLARSILTHELRHQQGVKKGLKELDPDLLEAYQAARPSDRNIARPAKKVDFEILFGGHNFWSTRIGLNELLTDYDAWNASRRNGLEHFLSPAYSYPGEMLTLDRLFGLVGISTQELSGMYLDSNVLELLNRLAKVGNTSLYEILMKTYVYEDEATSASAIPGKKRTHVPLDLLNEYFPTLGAETYSIYNPMPKIERGCMIRHANKSLYFRPEK